ncbi:hypothetical protein SUGI_1076930 [Cryptomeria japonica]|uniref:uncharacterized protein LOC131040485 n=1 Tax=Cryptomeria japonica TaxID=3369 RepID=UPI002414AD09|nr:uncharacterized protein LOC131040485 [Cryptomeria japonica]GLJ50547.1 hypothetical protein SUGI_1076930 [Cryptomeria japonica]
MGERGVRKKSAWNTLRMTLFMIRKCLLKRKILQELDLRVRGKVFAKIFKSSIFHRTPAYNSRGLSGLREYEFSCSNSPATPALQHFASRLTSCRHFLSCFQPDFSFEDKYESRRFVFSPCAIKEGVTGRPFENPARTFQEEDNQEDRKAEEFIARFYSQMKFQRQTSLLRYEEMLARGVN